ncbi:hypothetical protein ACMGE6_11415 [Macrococcus equi]|uniref:hypothetical protein n=1 Tax=Macrococcus equi TaxID=3395462 RepID=UPI0039BDBD26
MTVKKDRSEYYREYRKRNIERIKLKQKERYMNKKLGIKKEEFVDPILIEMKHNKQERINNMSVRRKKRRQRVQELIFRELEACS